MRPDGNERTNVTANAFATSIQSNAALTVRVRRDRVDNVPALRRKGQGACSLRREICAGRHIADHEGLGGPAQRVLKQARQLRVAERDSRLTE